MDAVGNANALGAARPFTCGEATGGSLEQELGRQEQRVGTSTDASCVDLAGFFTFEVKRPWWETPPSPGPRYLWVHMDVSSKAAFIRSTSAWATGLPAPSGKRVPTESEYEPEVLVSAPVTRK